MNNSRRLQRAVDFIEQHLQEALSMEAIAQAAAISKWHFQTVFHAVLGDTVKEYIRKRRLTLAAGQLASTQDRILDIALAAGFQSQESFSRAFKGLFFMTPGDYRKQGVNAIKLHGKPKITATYINHLHGGITMTPVFKTRDAMTMIGMQARFISAMSPDTNNFEVIPDLWRNFKARRHEIKHIAGSTDAGLVVPYIEGPKSHPDEMVYIACAPVSSAAVIPDGMARIDIPKGKYAVFTHKGPVGNIPHTVKYIYGSWLPKSKLELRNAPQMNVMDHRFRNDSADSELDIYVPVT
jgi:AraC family transcriptional regulator